jgi:predicted transcriptional regulator
MGGAYSKCSGAASQRGKDLAINMDGFRKMFGRNCVEKTADTFTVRDFAEQCNVSLSTAQRRISDMVTVGQCEHVGNVAITDLHGDVRSYSAAYRLTEKGRKCIQT